MRPAPPAPPVDAPLRDKRPDQGGELACSFCGKRQREVKKLIAGPTVYICDECIGLCNDILAEDAEGAEALAEVMPPRELLAELDRFVVGQAAAKRALVAAVRQQNLSTRDPSFALRGQRLLLVGPRGSGKTTLARALAAVVTTPIYHGDAATLTEAGYIGDDVEYFLQRLLELARGDFEVAQRGILFLDGIEKIKVRRNPDRSRDISGESVQRELLRVLDGLVVGVPPKGRSRSATDMLLFSCEGLTVVAAVRVEVGALPRSSSQQRLLDLLEELGLLPEFLARFDRIVALEPLGMAEMSQVLALPDGLIEAERITVEALGGTLEYTSRAIEVLAAAAADDGDGAWALGRPVRRHLEAVLTSDSPAQSWVVDGDIARELLLGHAPPSAPTSPAAPTSSGVSTPRRDGAGGNRGPGAAPPLDAAGQAGRTMLTGAWAAKPIIARCAPLLAARGYRVTSVIGRGSYGVVVEASNEAFGMCAVKLPRAERVDAGADASPPTSSARGQGPNKVYIDSPTGPFCFRGLESDEEAIALLSWTCGRQRATATERPLPRLFEVLDLDGTPAAVMERIEGPTLREEMTRAPDRARACVPALARAVLDLHASFGVHGDLKPENIVLSASGPVLLDPVGAEAWGGSLGYWLPLPKPEDLRFVRMMADHSRGTAPSGPRAIEDHSPLRDVGALAAMVAEMWGGDLGWNEGLVYGLINSNNGRFGEGLDVDRARENLRRGAEPVPPQLRPFVLEGAAALLDACLGAVPDVEWPRRVLTALAKVVPPR